VASVFFDSGKALKPTPSGHQLLMLTGMVNRIKFVAQFIRAVKGIAGGSCRVWYGKAEAGLRQMADCVTSLSVRGLRKFDCVQIARI
jgi:hypothetical protein